MGRAAQQQRCQHQHSCGVELERRTDVACALQPLARWLVSPHTSTTCLSAPPCLRSGTAGALCRSAHNPRPRAARRRWRWAPGPDGEQVRQSNARFVRWSDGSLQLWLGDEVLDAKEIDISGDHSYAFVRHQQLIQVRDES